MPLFSLIAAITLLMPCRLSCRFQLILIAAELSIRHAITCYASRLPPRRQPAIALMQPLLPRSRHAPHASQLFISFSCHAFAFWLLIARCF